MSERLKSRSTLSGAEVVGKLRNMVLRSPGNEEKTGKDIRKLVGKYFTQQADNRPKAGLYVPHRVLVKDYRNGNKAYLEFADSPTILIHQAADDDGNPTPWQPSNAQMVELGPLAVRVFHITVDNHDREEREEWTETFEAAFGPDGTFR